MTIRIPALILVSLTLIPLALAGEEKGKAVQLGLTETDRVRLAEAFTLADKLGNRIWPNWDKAPFAVILVTPDYEYLIRHNQPTDDFKPLGEDTLLKEKVWYRPRTFNPAFLATFPAVRGVSTIVIGQAENTEAKTSARWVITLLHEHFHQLQNSQPRHFADVDGLGLAKGDQTGMWMLNYGFPYDKPEVDKQLKEMAHALFLAWSSINQPEFKDRVASYLKAKQQLRGMVSADDYKYLNFQLWQEGIARYTEWHLAKLASKEHKPNEAFRSLPDYQSYQAVADRLLSAIERECLHLQPARNKRTIVYNLGAAEGLLLDYVNPDWRKQYFVEKFSLDKHFEKKP